MQKGCRVSAKSSAHSPLPLTEEGGRRSGMHTAVIHCSSGSKKLGIAHAFFSVDYPCFAGNELQILLQL